jgi:hypothetical protein
LFPLKFELNKNASILMVRDQCQIKYIVLLHLIPLHNSTEFKDEIAGWQESEVKREITVIHNQTQGEHIIAH